MSAEAASAPIEVSTTETAALEERVRCCLTRRICDFRLLVREGGLVLRGSTRTYYAKQVAQHAVMAAANLPIRANEIEVY
jgi:hypothetical protein